LCGSLFPQVNACGATQLRSDWLRGASDEERSDEG